MSAHRVQALLMGGQACVLYGAAEFSRDTDFAICFESENLSRLQSALNELEARVIAIPPFEPQYLARGHAVHFRCAHPDAAGLRVDVMSKMRGVAPFEELWARRTTVEISDDDIIEVLSLPDLVQAKKTQRDKDWPMLRRLLEVHYLENRAAPSEERIRFWLRELRTPSLLREVAASHANIFDEELSARNVLSTLAADEHAIEAVLREEEESERRIDREYWRPLREELEFLRRKARIGK